MKCGSKVLNFLGVDEREIAGKDYAMIIALSLIMIFKNLFRTIKKLIKSFWLYITDNIFNVLELAINIQHLMIITDIT